MDMFQTMRRKPFINPHIGNLRRSIWDFILWKVGHYDDALPKGPPPSDFAYPAKPKKYIEGNPSAMWVGHSTYLIEIEGVRILTDPVWDNYCSPIPIRMLKRKEKPPIALKELGRIDIVLLSHNHYDHLDAKTVAYLKNHHPQIEWIVPAGLGAWFRKRLIHQVTELNWWQSCTKQGCRITAVPAQHFSGRSLWDSNMTHWNGYVLERADKKLYFSGDTGYNDKDFKEIGTRFRAMDLSLLPIGTYAPKKFMEPVHISPKEAVAIHQDVHSRFSLGMHWNTFRLSEEPFNRPPYDLYLAMKDQNLEFQTFLPIDIGTYVNF